MEIMHVFTLTKGPQSLALDASNQQAWEAFFPSGTNRLTLSVFGDSTPANLQISGHDADSGNELYRFPLSKSDLGKLVSWLTFLNLSSWAASSGDMPVGGGHYPPPPPPLPTGPGGSPNAIFISIITSLASGTSATVGLASTALRTLG
jgi:hypothetical protein